MIRASRGCEFNDIGGQGAGLLRLKRVPQAEFHKETAPGAYLSRHTRWLRVHGKTLAVTLTECSEPQRTRGMAGRLAICMIVFPRGEVKMWIATYLGQALGWYHAGEGAGLIGATVGAIIVLLVWGAIAGRRRTTLP